MAVKTVNWIDFIPEGWQFDQWSNWIEKAPNFTLPAGKIYAPGCPTQGDTILTSIAKGATHVSKFVESDEGLGHGSGFREYNDVPRTFEIFMIPDGPFPTDMSESTARNKGQAYPISHLWIGETLEGTSYLEQNHQIWRWYYDEIINRYQARAAVDGKPWYVAHNYGGVYCPPLYQLWEDDLNQKRQLYTQPPSNWNPTNSYHGTLSRLNLHCAGVYNFYFDQRDLVYQKIFELEWAKKQVGNAIIFMAPVYEAQPGYEHAIYTTNPAGKMGVSDKQPIPIHENLSMSYVSMEWGDGLVGWGQMRFATKDVNKLAVLPGEWGTLGPEKWRWQPAPGSPSSFPFVNWQTSETFPAAWNMAIFDLMHWGVLAYGQSAATWGGERKYATWRIGSGGWRQREPDGSDVIWASRDKTGLAAVKRLGNARKVMYINPYGDNIARTIEIQDPWDSSIIYTSSVAGAGLHVANTTI